MMVGLSLGLALGRPTWSKRTLVGGALLAALPDVDAIGYFLGVPYDSPLGHRGITHALFTAMVVGGIAALLHWRQGAAARDIGWLWLYWAAAMASHGLLDSLTDGGGGVALLAPFDWSRYFAPWRPIAVSPMGIRGVFSGRGLRIAVTEGLWVWLPAALLVAAPWSARRRRASGLSPSA